MKANTRIRFISFTTAVLTYLAINSNAAIVFHEDFNRSDNSVLGNNWVEASTGAGEAAIANNQLQIVNGNTAGRTYIYQDTQNFGSGYESQLNQNAGIVAWTLNMRANRSALSGFNSSSYGIAFVLGTSSSDFLTGTGYAIVWGQSGNDPLRLVRYTAGLNTGSTISSVIAGSVSPFDNLGTEFLSIRVTYDPSNDSWELLAREDLSGFADPSTGDFASLGTAVDSTYVNTSLNYMGALWNYNTIANQSVMFDNIELQAIPEPTAVALGIFAFGMLVLAGCRRAKIGLQGRSQL